MWNEKAIKVVSRRGLALGIEGEMTFECILFKEK